MLNQDIIDCLDHQLAKRQTPTFRIDTASLPTPALRAYVEACEERAKRAVTYVNSHMPPEKRREVYVFLCNDEAYGASIICARYNYIVMNIGVPLRLLHFCERMMEAPQLWPDVSAESFQAFCVVLTYECLDLIVRHELAHLLLGHLDNDAQHAARSIRKVAQALEFLADGHAAIFGYEALAVAARVANSDHSPVAAGCREFHRTRATALKNYFLAVYFTFRIRDEDAPQSMELGTIRHLPTPMRFNVACIHLAEHFMRMGDNEAYEKLVQADTWERGEEIFSTLLDRQVDAALKQWTMSAESEAYYNQISDLAGGSLPRNWFELEFIRSA